MPERDGEFEYRVRSSHEPHERVVRESQLLREVLGEANELAKEMLLLSERPPNSHGQQGRGEAKDSEQAYNASIYRHQRIKDRKRDAIAGR